MNRLRIALPPLAELGPSEQPWQPQVDFARLDRASRVVETGRCPLGQLGALGKGARPLPVECFLHPQDSLLTSIELPQLPAARIKAAVTCAAQALILGPLEQMHVAHGPRDSAGQVVLGWLPRERLQALGCELERAGLKLQGLYPAPYALAVPAPAQVNLCLVDGQLVLRYSAGQGSVQPLLPQSRPEGGQEPPAQPQWQEALEQLRSTAGEPCWIGHEAPPGIAQHLASEQRWSGPAPAWSLHAGAATGRVAAKGWGRALGCCALAVVVWVAGLNLYAAREAEQGQRLKTQMNLRVRQVFPELPVVLNPLQQARQQLAARQSGNSAEPNQGFANLLLQAASAMPFMVGSVQRLTFAQERLQLELLPDTPMTADDTWQGALAQAGYSVQREANGWSLVPGGQPTGEQESAGRDDDE
ncbi:MULTISPECIES: type II secretion system protein GspL [unclassified Pseudomonas]|uniref:type II secretion system protein GspL n=1 Tax=unclassified Pseudomonas TaxID=196821 RepID=UPI0008387694|nr:MULTISPECIES: type II secretion system protein GspL [unclassified Pseudomonas]QIH07710.1 type II secretion system protein GspL [Pseudomonas sp. BIOMIG1BAC]